MIKLFPQSEQSGTTKKRGWYGHVDGGGTYTRIVIAEKGSGKVVYERKYTSADYASFDEIIVSAFEDARGVPDKMVFAPAGPINLEKQQVKFTNRPGWPIFDLKKLEAATGVEGLLVNDMQLIAADAAWTDQAYLTPVKSGKLWPEGRVMALTWSTGLNGALAEFGHTVALETGFGGAIASQTEDESSYCDFVAKKLGAPYATPEQLLGGAQGLNYGPEWLESIGGKPGAKTEEHMLKLKKQHEGLGPAITGHAKTDPFCQRIICVFGGLYGTHLRDLLATYAPRGGMHLVGSVNVALVKLLADPKMSPMLKRIDDPTLPYHNIVSNVNIVLNQDETLLSRGARVLAR